MPTPKTTFKDNPVYYDRGNLDFDIGVSIGARWSGKSWGVVADDCIELGTIPHAVTVACRKVYSSIKESIYANYLGTLARMGAKVGQHFESTVSPLEIRFRNGSRVIFKGMDDPRKTKGLERASKAIFEEGDEFDLIDYNTVELSMRGTERKHKMEILFNPFPITPGVLHWLQSEFLQHEYKLHENTIIDDPDRGRICITWTTYADNIFTPKKVIKILEGYKHTNPTLYKQWTLGQFVEMSGTIFKYTHVPAVPEGATLLGYGLDFGFSIDPSAALEVWVKDRELYLIGKVYSTDLTPPQLSAAMDEAGIPRDSYIVPDSSRPDTIQELTDMGWRDMWPVHKGPNYKTDVIGVLQGYTIHIVQGSHPGLVKEIATYSWRQTKDGAILIPPKPQDGNDHFMDCLIMVARERLGAKVEMTVPDVPALDTGGLW